MLKGSNRTLFIDTGNKCCNEYKKVKFIKGSVYFYDNCFHNNINCNYSKEVVSKIN